MSARPKVFCIGFQKTGTTSLHAALTRLGYRTVAVVGRDWTAERLAKDGAALCIATARDHDAAEDMPWPVFFRELDAAYPGSKFILTVRSEDRWFASIEKHFGDRANEMQAFIYGGDAAAPAGNRARYLDVYAKHERDVRAHFADRPNDLLVMNLEAGDAWPMLCDFLGAPIPREPFPVRNRSADRERFGFRLRRKVGRIFGRYLAPEQI
ncbi:MAG: sulfotransferase family protein [Pseudomonadota bacterium]